jgi:uncharacterized membrane protein YphA (DoxX/SURF4 family)
MVFIQKYRELSKNIISLLFIVLFVYTAMSKLLDFETFQIQLAQSPLLSAYAGIIAWLVPGVEIIIALLLVFERFRILALYAAFTLMVMFTAYIYIILNFSDFVPCSCGGVLEDLSWTQHFIFNAVFILLAATAIFFSEKPNKKYKLFLLTAIAILGCATVTLLFAFSEEKMHRNNAFVRRYIPHAVVLEETYDLKYNSWYIAGINSGKIYLGNVTAPLQVLVLDTFLRKADTVRINLDNMNLPYKSVTVSVGQSNFYVSDGTVPNILKGSKVDWKATTLFRDLYFTAATPMDSSYLALRVANARTLKNSLLIVGKKDSSIEDLPSYQLPAKRDGIFESDGQLLWNDQLQKLVYSYFYSNRYLILSPALEISKQHTIDTVTTPSLEIISSKSLGQDKLKRNAEVINQFAATYGNYLFIKSIRLGQFEPKELLEEASIIDVYDISKNEYISSFYLYHHNDKKLTSFYVVKNILYAILEETLVKYSLDNKIF